MRILFTSDPELAVPPKLYGGVQRLVHSILVGVKERGHEVGLVAHPESTSPAHQFFAWRGIRSQNNWDSVRNMLLLRSAVQSFRPDIVHSFSRLLYMLPFMTSPMPKIMSYGRKPSRRQVAYASRLAGGSLTFTGCSRHITEQGERAGGVWRTIYNFVELESFTFQPSVRQDAPLVFLSRVEECKGAHLAIATALKAGLPLLIAGNHGSSGEEGRYWEKEIIPHLGKNGIEYVGPVDDTQKNSLLGQARAMIVPIQWDEPFGIVFAEALACGTPVISCPRGALPEIVRDRVDGYWVNNVEEACAAIAKLPAISRAECRRRVETEFTSTAVVGQYLELYRQTVENKLGRG